MLPEDLKHYRSPDAFQLITAEQAAIFLLVVFAIGCVLQFAGVI